MVMRFHPGMAVGHTYQNTVTSATNHFSGTYGSHGLDNPSGAWGNEDSEALDSEPEFAADSDGSMDSMDGEWPGEGNVNSQYDDDPDGDINGGEEDINDEEFLALEDMYE